MMKYQLLTITLLYGFEVAARLIPANSSYSHDLLLTHDFDIKRDTCAVSCTRKFIAVFLAGNPSLLLSLQAEYPISDLKLVGCCDAGEACCGSGCMTAGDHCCAYYSCDPGHSCCGTGCNPPGTNCCGGIGYYCPGAFQCISAGRAGAWQCCTDDSCDVYWDGTSTRTATSTSTKSTMTTTSMMVTTTSSSVRITTTPTTTSKSTSTKISTTTTTTTSAFHPIHTTCNKNNGPQPTFHLKFTSHYEDGLLSLAHAYNPHLQNSYILNYVSPIDHRPNTLFTFNHNCNLIVVSGPHAGWTANIHVGPHALNNGWSNQGWDILFFDPPYYAPYNRKSTRVICDFTPGLDDVGNPVQLLQCRVPGSHDIWGTWLTCLSPGVVGIGDITTDNAACTVGEGGVGILADYVS